MLHRRSLVTFAVTLALASAAQAQAEREPVALVPDEHLVPLYRRAWVRPITSLLVPGSGQLLGWQERGVVYLATEVWFLARALALHSEGRRERDHFRSLAFTVARRQFTSVRRDGPFSYYEEMSEFAESGAYDADPLPSVQPETDTMTFNGAAWLLARQTYFENPDSIPAPTSSAYQAALAFYTRRAVREDFRWSWRDARLEQDVFRNAIRASDEAFRTATNFLGAVVLNHLASAVDAFITYRIGAGHVVPRVGMTDASRAVHLLWHASF